MASSLLKVRADNSPMYNLQRQGLEVFVYFDNDLNGHAAFNVRRLQERMQEQIMSEH